ncbi:MAG: CoA transferase, partial [Marinicaulis sp.]|nr:CoA transferase [Marinicaulis sp.]
LWFAQSIYPQGWSLPPVWDAIAGDYQTADGWIKLHTNAPPHRDAVLQVLGVAADREHVANSVRLYDKNELETDIVDAGGAAAAMRDAEAWAIREPGKAVTAEPLIAWSAKSAPQRRSHILAPERPLSGIRVLDLTRVLAGPVATRTLAGFGADVLRIDPPVWDEPNVVADISLGKRCARLDLTAEKDRKTFEGLLAKADILVHGYRNGALDGLGFDEQHRRDIAPHLLDIALNAYGWTGPWTRRRGFDSLVQMSCGIAQAGMDWALTDKPTPLPVQALDHATGYLMAAAAIKLLTGQIRGDGPASARLSLARTANVLIAYEQDSDGANALDACDNDFQPDIEATPWGPARRLKPPLDIAGTPMRWALPACELGSGRPAWDT